MALCKKEFISTPSGHHTPVVVCDNNQLFGVSNKPVNIRLAANRYTFLLFLFAMLFSHSVFSKTYIREYTYKASDIDSKHTSRINAIDQVKYILLQEIGVHIRIETNITKDSRGNTYASEDVEAITVGLTKVEIIEEKWNGKTYYLKAKIEVDSDRVLNELKEIKEEKSENARQQLETLKENQKELKAARETIAQLQMQLSNSTVNDELVASYNKQVEIILLSEMFDRGYDYSQQGLYEDAIYWYIKAANQGSSSAQFNLGLIYSKDAAVVKDYVKSAYWYRKAAEQGHARAQYNLGVMYDEGQGVKQDYVQAVYWYRKAAEQGRSNAQSNLGAMYLHGTGVKQDYEIALSWIDKALVQDEASAQSNLGVLYLWGRGVKQSYSLAFVWIGRAAEQGYAPAQSNLGTMYNEGYGMIKNHRKAKELFKKACEGGYKEACPYY